jgi:hypothetical protein
MSGVATASLVFAILGSMCLGPVGGIAAVVVGIIALVDIKQSQGKKSGTPAAAIGIAIGAVVTLAYIVVAFALFSTASKAAKFTPPHHYSPPVATAPPGPSSSAPSPRLRAETEMSKDTTTTETRIGAITVVDLGSNLRSLESELRVQRAQAAKLNQKLILQTTSMSCRPCLGVAASLADPKMQRALDKVRLVRVDIADFKDDLLQLGMASKLVGVMPTFMILGVDLLPIDAISGEEWDDDTADNIAPVLSQFSRGALSKRRNYWTPPRKRQHPGGTSL